MTIIEAQQNPAVILYAGPCSVNNYNICISCMPGGGQWSKTSCPLHDFEKDQIRPACHL